MTWDEIGAAYPPDTWLVLEVIERESTPYWQDYEAVRGRTIDFDPAVQSPG